VAGNDRFANTIATAQRTGGGGVSTRMTGAAVRVPHARAIAIGLTALVCLVILWLSRNFNFYFDEWDFILAAPNWTPMSVLEPHNGHPSMLLISVYAVLLNTIGLRSYLPYMAVLLVLHATSVVLLFELVRRRSGDLIGLAAGALLVALGAGWENLLWAFQIGSVGAVACGLGMLLALEGPRTSRRLAMAAALLTASLMFSGIGLCFGVAAAVQLGGSPGRRRNVVWFIPTAIALGAWYLAFGRHNAAPGGLSAGTLVTLPLYIGWGVGSAIAGLAGLGGVIGLPMALVGVALVLVGWRRKVDLFTLSIAAALLTFYLVAGLNRAQFGYEQSGAGRYVYEGAAFWILILSDAARDLPWHGTWRPALAACLFLACFNNAVLLVGVSAAKTVQMQREDADLYALQLVRNQPCRKASGAVDPLVMPQVNRPDVYYRAIDRFGSPPQHLVFVVGGPQDADLTRALDNLSQKGCM
jgi:hypothetical protein